MSSYIVVSPLLRELLGRLNSFADGDLKAQFKEITAALETVEEVVDEAEEKMNSNDDFRDWLLSLPDVLHELDDLIDDEVISINEHEKRNPASSAPSTLIGRILQRSKSATQLESLSEILEALEKIAEKGKQLALHDEPEPVRESRGGFVADTFLDPDGIIGRQSDKDKVADLLRNSLQTVPVVPILGSMGIGKTVLAQLIYNELSFDLKLWIRPERFEDTNQFLELLAGQLSEDDRSQKDEDGDGDDDGDVTQQKKIDMQDLLKSKRSLIVLDNVEDNALHKNIARDLMDMLSSTSGNAILLTTRSRRAASLIGNTPAYQLQPLSVEYSYKLLAWNAFPSMLPEQDRGEFEVIGREFATSCCGVPLFLQMMGSFLYEKNSLQEWKKYIKAVKDYGFARLEDEEWADVMVEFPTHLKLPFQCFGLKKACGLGVEALMCVWMALGFLYNSDGKAKPLEYIAKKNLKDFSDCALFPEVHYAPGGAVQQMNFNDALYEMATQSANPKWVTVRADRQLHGLHMYIIWDQECVHGRALAVNIEKPEYIRLFMVKSGRQPTVQFIKDVVSCLRNLRVLGLGRSEFESLPDSVGELRHLRYLDLGRNSVMKSLPDSICYLPFLQTLLLHGCSKLEDLPSKFGKLRNLRYLTLRIRKQSLPDAVGELANLRTLGLTCCAKLASLPSTIKNLKNLATLAVVNCPKMDSSVKGFNSLISLQTLLLSHLPKFEGVPLTLENPSGELKHLQIMTCPGLKEIKWVSLFKSLRSLTIADCHELTEFAFERNDLLELVIRRCPKLGDTAWIKHFVALRSLVIDDCTGLECLDAGFAERKVLERLEIKDCHVLKEWLAEPAGIDWRRGIHVPVVLLDGERL